MKMQSFPYVGILGGMGPYASLDLFKKILRNTRASSDQEHIPVLLASLPHYIPGRSEYLLQTQPINPGTYMAELVLMLEGAGVTHCAVPCNTAHASPIWSNMCEELKKASTSITFIHIIDAVKQEIAKRFENSSQGKTLRIGVLATSGTIQTGLYNGFFDAESYTLVYPRAQAQEQCMDAIFNKNYGLKAFSENVTAEAHAQLQAVLNDLNEQGVDLFILGCTELSFALTEPTCANIPCIDPVTAQARAIIAATYPEKLLPA